MSRGFSTWPKRFGNRQDKRHLQARAEGEAHQSARDADVQQVQYATYRVGRCPTAKGEGSPPAPGQWSVRAVPAIRRTTCLHNHCRGWRHQTKIDVSPTGSLQAGKIRWNGIGALWVMPRSWFRSYGSLEEEGLASSAPAWHNFSFPYNSSKIHF